MARQQVRRKMAQGRVAMSPVLVGIAALGFWSGFAEKAADTMCYIACALTGMGLEALPVMLLALGRWLELFVLEHERLLCFAHLLGNLAPLLHWLVGAI